MTTYRITCTEDGAEYLDPWGNDISTMSADSAFDCFLRILDHYGCIPGWLALSCARSDFERDGTAIINGIQIVCTSAIGNSRFSKGE